MAFTTVITHATGDVFPASDWNTYIRDNINYFGTHGELSGVTMVLNGTVSYTAPSGTTFLEVEGNGGGGGGGGVAGIGGGADVGVGGTGASFASKLVSTNIGTHTVAVGAGGTGGPNGGGSGGTGGVTTFKDSAASTVLSAAGGPGGQEMGGSAAQGFADGAQAGASTGDHTLSGVVGWGMRFSTGGHSQGGAAARGGAGIGNSAIATQAGAAPSIGYGGGGSGGIAVGAVNSFGGGGSAGIMRIKVYG